MRFLTQEENVRSPVFFVHNYGVFDIPLDNNNVLFYGSLRDGEGNPIVNRYYTKSDMSFDERTLRYSNLCLAKGMKQKWFRKMLQASDLFFLRRNWKPSVPLSNTIGLFSFIAIIAAFGLKVMHLVAAFLRKD